MTEVRAPAGDTAALGDLQRRLGYRFERVELLAEALSHRSWCHEQSLSANSAPNLVAGAPAAGSCAPASNERLEFLGDAVLNLCVSDLTMSQWPELGPGELSAVRSAVVSTSALAEAARGCDLGAALLLARGEAATGGADKDSILADGFEAVIGAVFTDSGLVPARDLVQRLLGDRIAEAAREPRAGDAKNRFQELVARQFGTAPRYETASTGPPHRPTFTAEAWVDADVWGRGSGPTKRSAERQAAEQACLRLARVDSAAAPPAKRSGRDLDAEELPYG